MFVLQRRMSVTRYLAAACVFALLALSPYRAGATAPATAAPAALSTQPSVPDAAKASAAPKKEPTEQKSQTPKVAAPKKQPSSGKKVSAGKKAAKKTSAGKKAAKKTQPAKAAKAPVAKAAKPVAKQTAKPGAAKPENGDTQKDEALKIFPIANVPKIPAEKAVKLPVAETWKPLMNRLAKDGVERAYLRSMFGRLGDSYSHVPMGTKINELFTYKYMPRPPRKAVTVKKTDTPSTPPVYKWALKPENVDRCKEYLERHKKAFAVMEQEYGIPKEVVAGLLMVETKLGTYLGASSSFWSLACLAASDTPERVDPTLQTLPLPMTDDKMEWVSKLLQERSVWAYKELLALIKHCKTNDLDPLVMPGSVYGAIGICQFMPSNLPKFAVDGNKDGKIDLFEPGDAIPSVGNYLKKHGWEGENRDVHHKVIKKYNKSNVYANTILALAEAIVAPPVDPNASPGVAVASAGTVKKTASGEKNAAKKSAKASKPAAKAAAKPKKASGKKGSSTKKAPAKAAKAPAAPAPAKTGSEQTGSGQVGSPKAEPVKPLTGSTQPGNAPQPGNPGQANQGGATAQTATSG